MLALEVDQMLADTSSSNVAGKLFLGSLGYSAPIKHVYLSKQVTFREKVHTGAALQLEEHVHGRYALLFLICYMFHGFIVLLFVDPRYAA